MEFKSRREEVVEMYKKINKNYLSVAELSRRTGLSYQLTRHIVNEVTTNPTAMPVDKLYHFLKDYLEEMEKGGD